MSTTADNVTGRSTCADCRFYEERELTDRETQPQWSCIADYCPETISKVCCFEVQDVATHSERPACRYFEPLGKEQ